MPIVSRNPATEQVLREYQELSAEEIRQKLAKADEVYQEWKLLSFGDRGNLMRNLAETLRFKAGDYGKLITEEMGKPITQAISEVEKCAWVCEFYADNAEEFLAPEVVKTDASDSYVRFDSLGIILAVMPWNFPFWQVLRFTAPTLMAGNVGILKHASNVPQCAVAIEEAFRESGFPDGVFQSLLIGSGKVDTVLSDDRVKGVALTGSEYAGSQVASLAGKLIKPSVLELGGSDPLIVLADANLQLACEAGTTSRMISCGQCCISAKRFIVVEEVVEEFTEMLARQFENLVLDDPMNELTTVGALANEQILKDITRQVDDSVKAGAEVVIGGLAKDGPGYFYEPTILTKVQPGMPVYEEETFGPVAALITVKDAEEAVQVANDSEFGLGASLWTKDMQQVKQMVPQINAGAVFVNGIVKSDPRLPFGGIGKSGYGRELADYGIKEFVNVKSVWIK